MNLFISHSVDDFFVVIFYFYKVLNRAFILLQKISLILYFYMFMYGIYLLDFIFLHVEKLNTEVQRTRINLTIIREQILKKNRLPTLEETGLPRRVKRPVRQSTMDNYTHCQPPRSRQRLGGDMKQSDNISTISTPKW